MSPVKRRATTTCQRMTKLVGRAVAQAEAEGKAEVRAQAEADAFEMALTFIRMRAGAVLLREAGWDAVPLLRRYPSLVVMARDSTAAIRDWRGTVHRAGFGAPGPITVETEKKIAAIEVTASGSRVGRCDGVLGPRMRPRWCVHVPRA